MTSSTRYETAFRATLVNSSVNTLLALLKITVGFIGHSQALIADGIHSFSDLITDLLVLLAAKMGGQRPDTEHPYGHHRIETVGAILVSLILMTVAIGIAYETIHQLLRATAAPLPTIPVILVAIFSILANEGLYRYTLKAGNQVNSDLLRTNAWHNRSDALVSLIVLVSVAGTLLGLTYLDAVGALFIAGLILHIGIKMIWKSGQELIDAGVNEALLEEIKTHITETPGVCSLHQLRTRSHGGYIFTDVHIQVDPFISVSEGHYIGEQVHLNLIRDFEAIADVTVHIDPEDDETKHPSQDLPIRSEIEKALKAAWENLPGYESVKSQQFHYLNGKLEIDLILSLAVLQQQSDSTALAEQYRSAIASIPYIEQINLYYT